MMFEDTDSQDWKERPPSPRDDDLYGLLGVNRDASLDEIKTAYRTRSRIFHPDKHSSQDQERQQEAVLIFHRIKRAHDVLSDETLRTVYDIYGLEGLDSLGPDITNNDSSSSNMQIILRGRTPREMRQELEDMKREKEKKRMQERSNPRSTFIVGINACQLFT